ncbi:DsbA family protein [Pseudonocardia sp. GCM10023141]|uniref:DsbA family protein n=1 Tax=Pseudonocardia sp. GCM10023141 TaxID=3252653 RepID=UPI00361DFD79
MGTGADRRRKAALARRRGPSPLMIIGIVVIVLFAGAIGFAVYRAQGPSAEGAAVPKNATAQGVLVGQPTAKATVDVYLDFQCPVCNAYEKQSGATIDELVASGAAKVVYHPVAYLDRFSSGTKYSSRSSAAAGCAADEGVFPAYLKLLYSNQPEENGTGLPDSQLITLGQQAGAGAGFATCVSDATYAGWTKGVTDAASQAGVNGTPTVKVNGTAIDNTDAALRQAVAAANPA